MAQPVYEDHPLEQYLRESGDRPDHIPGAFVESESEEDRHGFLSVECPPPQTQWVASPLVRAVEILNEWCSSLLRDLFTLSLSLSLSSLSPSLNNNDFAERFKYDLISSNLLSMSVSPFSPPPVASFSRRPRSPSLELGHDQTLPGELRESLRDEEREKETEREDKSKNEELEALYSRIFLVIGTVAFLFHYRFLASAVLIPLLMFVMKSKSESRKARDGDVQRKTKSRKQKREECEKKVFDALESLKDAGSGWDAVVGDAMRIVESEERMNLASSGLPPPPSSTLRISLHSALLTTQHQCDNVRPLLAALASPMELSQLAEMYAPPSPPVNGKPFSFSMQSRSSASDSGSNPNYGQRRRGISQSENNAILGISTPPKMPVEMKRQTWSGANLNGSYGASGSSSVISIRRDRRRSDMNFLLSGSTSPSPAPALTAGTSSLKSPSPVAGSGTRNSKSLSRVSEGSDEEAEDQEEEQNSTTIAREELDAARDKDNFGTAALYLRRKRRLRGSGALGLGLASSKSFPTWSDNGDTSYSSLRSPPSLTSSLTSPRSRYTSLQSLQSLRHPFSMSLSALRAALNSALGSRRYACAHLLALRFDESDQSDTFSFFSHSSSHSGDVEFGGESNEIYIDEREKREKVEREEGEREMYWENIISVIGLLTSTMEDAVGRLVDVIREEERRRESMGVPSPSFSASPSPSPSPSPIPIAMESEESKEGKRGNHITTPSLSSQLYSMVEDERRDVNARLSATFLPPLPLSASSATTSTMGTATITTGVMTHSYAPVSSELTRFAGHVDSINSALDDARVFLGESVEVLRGSGILSASADISSTSMSSLDSENNLAAIAAAEESVLQAYERLRRELGLALRECERGKSALGDVFKAKRRRVQLATIAQQHEMETEAEGEGEDGPPGLLLGHDSASGGSADSEDKTDTVDAGPFTPNEGSPVLPSLPSLQSLDRVLARHFNEGDDGEDDDVTAHLLMSASARHLPQRGVEEVFEGDTGGGVVRLGREKPKMTREERIKLVRQRRESMQAKIGGVEGGMRGESEEGRRKSWGPTSDVVEELKDVIWKVGERRRKMEFETRLSTS